MHGKWPWYRVITVRIAKIEIVPEYPRVLLEDAEGIALVEILGVGNIDIAGVVHFNLSKIVWAAVVVWKWRIVIKQDYFPLLRPWADFLKSCRCLVWVCAVRNHYYRNDIDIARCIKGGIEDRATCTFAIVTAQTNTNFGIQAISWIFEVKGSG